MHREFQNKKLIAKSKEAPVGEEILNVVFNIAETLLEKNISYGNSALDPLNIFGDLSPEDGLYCRINDKLTRIFYNQDYKEEKMIDAVNDLIGYLILLRVLFDQQENL
jgi:hypothetical protein